MPSSQDEFYYNTKVILKKNMPIYTHAQIRFGLSIFYITNYSQTKPPSGIILNCLYSRQTSMFNHNYLFSVP